MILFIILLLVLFLLYYHYKPIIEKLKNGDYIMWYNNHENTKVERNFILIKKRNKYE